MNLILIKDNEKEEIVINDDISSFLKNKLKEKYFIIGEENLTNQIDNNEIKDQKNLVIFIPNDIDSKLVQYVYEFIKEKEKNKEYKIKKIYNIRDNDYDTYEFTFYNFLTRMKKLYQCENYFMDNSQIQNLKEKNYSIEKLLKEELSVSEVFLLFVNEKLNKLTNIQKELFNHYRNFNLENLLFIDEDLNFSLNNGNAGAITIFPNDILKSNVSKKYHENEFRKHLKSKNIDDKSINNKMKEIANKYQICFIRVCTGYFIIECPDKMNEYQQNELLKLLKEVRNLEKKYLQKVEVIFKDNYDLSIDEIINKLKKNKKIL